ncbi:MAG: hypothetical protein HRT54_17270 [Colwellia sp.]|nr:hypothetical protein [Colwellia sp.]
MRVFLIFSIFIVSFFSQSETYEKLPKLKNNQGYFVVSYSGNYPPYHLSIVSNDTIFKSQEDLSDFKLKKGYRVIVLDEGEYMYSRLKLAKHAGYYKLASRELLFTVTAGKVNYAGDLQFEYHHYNESVSSKVVNHISKTYLWLQENHPKLMDKRKIIYSGLGVDNFMNFYFNQ